MAVLAQPGRSGLLVNVCAELAGAVKQQVVKQAPFYRNLAAGARWKIHNHFAPIDCDELDRR